MAALPATAVDQILLTLAKFCYNTVIMFLFSTDVPYTNANSPGLAPTGLPMWQAEADIADNVCFACHSSGPNSVNHGEILLQYGTADVGF